MRFLREPLVHFLTIGALLFVFYGFVHDRREPTSDTIAVSAAQISLFIVVAPLSDASQVALSRGAKP